MTSTSVPRAGTDVSRPSYGQVVRRLASAQKSGRGAPAYSRFVNRRLGRYLAAGAFLVGLTPNTVTVVSGLVTFAGIAVLGLAPLSWTSGVVVTLLLVLGYALDAADGQLARLRGGGSPSGEWLDHMVDSAKISTLHLVVLLALFRADVVDQRWLLVPLGFTVVAAVSFFAQILNEQLMRQHGMVRPVGPAKLRVAATVVSLLKVPTDYGLLCLVFLLLGAPVLFFGVYTALFIASTGYLALALVKWFSAVRALDAQASA